MSESQIIMDLWIALIFKSGMTNLNPVAIMEKLFRLHF